MAHGDDDDNGGTVSNFNVEREEDDLDGDGDGDSDEDGLAMLTAAFAKPSKVKKNEKKKTITHGNLIATIYLQKWYSFAQKIVDFRVYYKHKN